MSRLLSNFALAKWKRALTFGQSRLTPLFYQKTLKRARMLRTLHSQNKIVVISSDLSRFSLRASVLSMLCLYNINKN